MNKITPSQKAGLKNCRDEKQLQVMVRHYMNGTCPFCGDPQEGDTPWLPISGVHWRVKENRWPFKHTKTHLVLALRRHVTSMSDVTQEEWVERGLIVARITERYGPIEGGVAARSGPLDHSAGTVEHYHENFLWTDLTGPVRLTLSKEVGGSELERREWRFEEACSKLTKEEQRFLFDWGIGLSSLLVNDIHEE